MANDGHPPTSRYNGVHGPIPDRNSPTTPTRVQQTTETMWQAAQLRAAGGTFREIGQALDIDPTWARTLVLRALDASKYEAADLMRTQEGMRLDRLQRAHWANALGGDVNAAKVVLRCMDRRARLFGLDAPVQAEVELKYTTEDMDAEVARLVELMDRADPA